MRTPQRLITVLTVSVFLTGFSALLYQVVWQRMLGLFSGSDVRSVTIVTSAFLAGLGVGSFVGSFLADRFSSRQAVQAFAACNLGIGAFAFLSRFLYYDVLFLEFQVLAENPAILLLIVFVSLLVPTTLMGLSLPFLSKAIVRNVENASSLITLLYGINTLGAGVGTLVAGWYLIGTVGYETAVYLGAGLSTAVGLFALLVAAQLTGDAQSTTTTRQRISLRNVPASVWGWCFLVFTSGFIVISLEIIWFRILDVTLKSNAYTFAHLLSFFLIGDALGSLVGSRMVHRIGNPRRTFLWLQGFITLYSVGIVLLISLFADSYPLGEYIRNSGIKLALTLEDNRLQWLIYIGLPALLMFPPSFMIGFYFPLVQKAVQTDPQMVGQRVGLTEVSNIMGNTLGGIVTGVVFLDVLGTADSLRLIAGLGLIFVLILAAELWRQTTPRWQPVPLVVALITLILIFPGGDTLWARLHGVEDGQDFWVAEDSTGVSAIRSQGEGVWLYANGHSQGRIPYSEVHSFLGTLPALVHPNPQRIMVVGIGSSGTPYTVGVNPATEQIIAVEIIGSELDVLSTYAQQSDVQAVNQFLSDPRYDIRVGDGRRELTFSEEPFDIIEADAIRPIASHSGLLFSQEYFETARDHLKPDGIMAQWNATYRTEATFVEVFPYAVVVGDVILGSQQPIPYDPARILAQLDDPLIIAYLEAGGVDINLLRSQITDPIRVYTPDTPREFLPNSINTDLFPRDEYYLNNGG